MFNPYPYPILPGGAQMPNPMSAAPQFPMGQNPATAGMGARPVMTSPQPQQQTAGGMGGMDPKQLMGLLSMFKGNGSNSNPGAGLLTGLGGIFGGGAGSNIAWNQFVTPGSVID